MSTSVSDIIRRIIYDIENTRNSEALDNLDVIPLETITKDRSDILMKWFLNAAAKSKNYDAVKIVLNEFDTRRCSIDPLPAITDLFLNDNITTDVLLFAIGSFPERDLITYYVDLINYCKKDVTKRIISNMEGIVSDLPVEDWITLKSMTEDTEDVVYENEYLREYFSRKITETEVSNCKPEWIIRCSPTEIKSYPKDLPSVGEAVDIIMKCIVLIINDFDEFSLKNHMVVQYSLSTYEERLAMLPPLDLQIFDDKDIFREYGPVNTLLYGEHENTHICSKNGGCRMLLCTEFEELGEDGLDYDIMCDDIIIEDWFRGSCDKCARNINRKYYAVREPLVGGGWRGCFCSYSCMAEFCMPRSEALGYDSKFIELMYNKFYDQLKSIGIRNRE